MTKKRAGTTSHKSSDFENTASADSNGRKNQHFLTEKNNCYICIYFSIYFLTSYSLRVGERIYELITHPLDILYLLFVYIHPHRMYLGLVG